MIRDERVSFLCGLSKAPFGIPSRATDERQLDFCGHLLGSR